MGQADVIRAEKAARERRERRLFTPDTLGRLCRHCRQKVPKALNDAGIWIHPTCGPIEELNGGKMS